MKQPTATSLFFLGSRPLKNGEYTIYLRVTIDGRYDQTAIKRSVPKHLWNQAKGCSKGKDINSQEINNYISQLRSRIYSIHRESIFSDTYLDPQAILIKLFQKEERVTLLKFFRDEIEMMKALAGIDFEKVTINRYENCYRSVVSVIEQEYRKADMSFSELNGAFISKLELHLKTQKTLYQNTIVRYMKCFKKITNLALQHDLLRKDPFAGVRYKQPETNPAFLTIDEVEAISNKQLSMKRISTVRDIFLFCCFTELAYRDLKTLSEMNLWPDDNGDL